MSGLSDKLNWLFGAVTVSIVCYFLYQDYDSNKLWTDKSVEKRITIGRVMDYYEEEDSYEVTLDYRFLVHDQLFESTFVIQDSRSFQSYVSGKNYVGKKFQVLFIVQDPSYSELLIGSPISEDTKAPPADGWSIEEINKLQFK